MKKFIDIVFVNYLKCINEKRLLLFANSKQLSHIINHNFNFEFSRFVIFNLHFFKFDIQKFKIKIIMFV